MLNGWARRMAKDFMTTRLSKPVGGGRYLGLTDTTYGDGDGRQTTDEMTYLRSGVGRPAAN
jgi:hypothetical protein